MRFLGSMAVRAGHTQEVIYEAMRQVLAARAIHNIFKTTESHLMVTSSCIRCVCRLTSELDSVSHIYRTLKTVFVSVNRLIDPQTQVTKISVSVDVLLSLRSLKPDMDSRSISVVCVCQFQLKDVTQFAAHQENSRLMGFVLQGSDWSDGDEDQPSFSVFVFESNTEGEKVRLQNMNLNAYV